MLPRPGVGLLGQNSVLWFHEATGCVLFEQEDEGNHGNWGHQHSLLQMDEWKLVDVLCQGGEKMQHKSLSHLLG